MGKPWEKAAAAQPRPAKPWEKAAQSANAPGALEPMGGASGEWDLSKFEALPRPVQPSQANAPNPITTAMRQSQDQVNADFAAKKAEEQRRAEAASRSRRESAAAFGGGMDLMPTEDAAGNVQPGSPVDMDIGKGLVTLPARIERGVVGAGQSIVNLPSDVADFLGSVNKPEYRSAPVPRADFSAAKVPIAPEMDSITGNLAEGLAQFLVSRKLVGSAAPGGGTVAQLGKDAIATGVGFDGSTGRVADMLDPNVIPEGPLRDYANFLRTQPEDSPLVGRFKNLLEDMTFSGPMVAPHAAIRGGQAVLDAVNPQIAPTNAGGARPGPVTPSPAPAPTAPVAPPQARQGAVPGAGQAAPQPAPVQTAVPPTQPRPQPTAAAPPGAPPAQPPAVVAQPAAGAPPPGVMTPVPAPSTLGPAERWYNSLPQKTREAILRTFDASNVSPADRFEIIRDLNNIPQDRNSQNAFIVAQKWGEKYPSLRENLSNIGGGFAVTNPRAPDQKVLGFLGKGRADEAQSIMDVQGRKQVVSERGFLERSAEQNFGAPSAEVSQNLKDELQGLGKRYNSLLDPTKKRRFGNDKLVQLQQAESSLKAYLKKLGPNGIPPEVQNRLMVDASDELRQLGWTSDELKQMAGPTRTMIAPLFEAHGALPWSPQMWDAIVEQYPKFAAHVLQSSYAKSARALEGGLSLGDNAGTIGNLRRARGIDRDGNVIPGGLLDKLEKTMPNSNFSFTGAGSYADTRVNYGDVKGAQEALKELENFKTKAQKGESVAEIIEKMENWSPRQKEAALSQITSFVHDSMGNKVRNVTPGQVGQFAETAPNLTPLGNDNFLQALRKVFGEQGDALANDIELARSSTTFNTDINRRLNSRTEINAQAVKNSPNVYEHPAGQEGGVFDKGVQALSAGGFGAAFVPGAQGAALGLASLAGVKAAWNLYKKGKRLTNSERNALADFWFRSRQAGVDPEAALNGPLPRIPGPRGPSPIGRIGNVVTGAGVGGAVGYGASGGDPNAAMMGALGGAGAGVARQAMRARASAKSLIPEVRVGRVGRQGGPIARMGFGGGGDAVGRKGSPTSMGGPSANELRISESINEMRSRGMSNENISSRLELNGIKIAPDRIDHFAKMTPATGSGRYKGNVISLNTRRAQGENKSGLPSGTSAAIGAIGGGAYGALGPLQDMDGDGDKDAADRQAMIAAYGMGGLSSGVAIGALKGAGRSVIGAMGRGGKGAATVLANAEKILADPRVASQLSPEQYQPLYETISKRMQEIQNKGLDKTQQGYAEVNRLNGLLMNYFKNPDGTQNLGKTFKRAEATDPYRTMRVKAGRAANDVEDGVTTSDAIDLTPDGYERTSQLGSASLKYSVGTDRKTMTLDVIEVPPAARGQKEASKALDALLAEADANKLTVYLDAKPIGKGGMTEPQLEQFYAKRGFTKQSGGTGMVRSPNGRPQFKINQQTFGGINAKTADKVALARAEQMAKEGASRDEIWDATGWFKGVDGKWRFEIDDSGASFAPIPRTPYMTELANQYARENFGVDAIINLPHNDVRRAEAIQWATNESRKLNDAAKNKTAPLSERLNHPQLNSAYDISGVKVGAENRPDLYGSYVPSSKTIRVADESPILGQKHDQFSTAIHETQHHLQEVEGFAKGGMPETALKEDLDAINVRLSQIAKSIENRRHYRYNTGINTKQVDAEIEALKEEYNALFDRRAQEFSPQKEREAYKRLAGEAEARNVQTRDAMRRRGEKPGRPWETQDVPDDQQIVRFGNNGPQESRVKLPPAQAGFGFGGGKGERTIGGLKDTAPKVALPKRMAEQFNQAKLSPELRAALAENAAKPAGEQLTPMEVAKSIDRAPEMYGLLTPYLREGTEVSARVSREIGKLSDTANADPVNVGLRKLGAEASLSKAEQALKETRSKQGSATRKLENQRARNIMNPNAKTLNEPFVAARDAAERATLAAETVRNDAKSTLDKFNLEVLNFENSKAAAERELQRISEAMGPKAPKVSGLPAYSPMTSRKIGALAPKEKQGSKLEAEKIHELVYSPAGAKLLAQIQSGEVVPKPYSTAHKMLSYLAQHPVQGVGAGLALAGSAGGYAAILSEADQANRDAMIKSGAMRDPNLPEPENPNAWNWEKQTQRPQFVETLQLNLQQVGYRIADDGHMYRKDGRETNTVKAIKHWQWSQGQEPTGVLTEDQYYTLQEQAQEARRSGGAANGSRATPSLQPMSQ